MSLWRAALPFTLVATMLASTFSIFAIAVLAAEIIDDLDLSRGGLGAIVAVNTLVGALTSPATGRLTDRVGPRRSVIAVLLLSSGGMALMALATTWWMLLVSSLVLGVPQGWGNPSTNSLISNRVQPGRQGVLTGVKQSGVTFGVFLAGLTLPGLAELSDWRGASWVYSGAFGLFALIVSFVLPSDDPTGSPRTAAIDSSQSKVPLASFVWRIAAYAFLLGCASGAISRFLALFAHEELKMSVTVAGLVVALTGLTGIGTRIWAAWLAETRVEPAQLLVWLAYSAVACSLLLVTATSVGSWVLWPTAVVFSFGFTAWNAVAMLAVIRSVTTAHAGRASGVVMLGFLGGYSVGTPAAGVVIDATGSYQPVWWAAAALSLLGSLVLAGPARSASDRTVGG